jgi:hypothetical protein
MRKLEGGTEALESLLAPLLLKLSSFEAVLKENNALHLQNKELLQLLHVQGLKETAKQIDDLHKVAFKTILKPKSLTLEQEKASMRNKLYSKKVKQRS